MAGTRQGTFSGGPGYVFVVGATVVVAVLFMVAVLFSPVSGLRDAAALAIIGGAAVGIERVIEAGWSAVALFKNSWWPLTEVAKALNDLVDQIGTTVDPFFTAANQYVAKTAAAEQWSAEKLAAAKQELENAQRQIANFKNLAQDDQRLKLIATSASQSISAILAQYNDRELRAIGQVALDSTAGLQSLLGTFQDNPGKRLVSLYVGAALGLVVVTAVGLDVFRAAGGGSDPSTTHSYLGFLFSTHWGTALTGIVIGLGSGPTHEVIKVIQEFKQGLMSGSVQAPGTQSTTTTTTLLPGGQR